MKPENKERLTNLLLFLFSFYIGLALILGFLDWLFEWGLLSG